MLEVRSGQARRAEGRNGGIRRGWFYGELETHKDRDKEGMRERANEALRE